MTHTHRFTGHIAGVGTSGGTRLVLGCWDRTPQGPFADVMVAHPDGRRELLAPTDWVADFVSATYTFDTVTRVPVTVQRTGFSRATWGGHDLGTLTDMTPPPDFGFSSTPRRPSLTALTSTVRVPSSGR